MYPLIIVSIFCCLLYISIQMRCIVLYLKQIGSFSMGVVSLTSRRGTQQNYRET